MIMSIIEIIGLVVILSLGGLVVVKAIQAKKKSGGYVAKPGDGMNIPYDLPSDDEPVKPPKKKPRPLDEDLVDGEGPADLLDPIEPSEINNGVVSPPRRKNIM